MIPGMVERLSAQKPDLHRVSRRCFLGCMAAAIAGPMVGTSRAGSRRVLRLRIPEDPWGFDPAKSGSLWSETVNSIIYSKLIAYKPGENWNWHLESASQVRALDRQRIHFRLKPDIYFTHGYGEMTAQDVKFSFERALKPDSASPLKADWEYLQGVELVDRYTGIIHLKAPFEALWLATLPTMSGNILSRKAVLEQQESFDQSPRAFSGPYRIKLWKPQVRTVLVKNRHWRGPDPAFDEIHLLPIDDDHTAEVLFDAGGLDFSHIGLSSLGAYLANPQRNCTVLTRPSLFNVWLGLNRQSPQLADPRVRQAIQMALDLPEMLQTAYFGFAKPSAGLIPPGQIGHRRVSAFKPRADLVAARKLLTAAGADQGIKLTLDAIWNSTCRRLASVMKANLSRIKIDIRIRLHTTKNYPLFLNALRRKKQFEQIELSLNRHPSVPDPHYTTKWFVGNFKGNQNLTGFASHAFDDRHDRAGTESDPDKRAALYRDMQKQMESSGCFRFITHEPAAIVYRNDFKPALRPDGMPLLRHFQRS